VKVPRAVLFDLDGTLCDSLPDISWALNEARMDMRLPPVTDGQVRSWVGGGAGLLVARSLGHEDDRAPDVAPLLAAFMRRYDSHAADESKLYPGVAELVDLLSERGVLMACTTNKPASAARALLDAVDVLSRLDALVTPETCGGAKKPDPRFMTTALRKLGVEAKDALVVGDALQDIQAAKCVGIRVVAILGGYGDPEALRAAGADEYVATIADVAPLLGLTSR
jgi:phosphoglycolate phosphatase